MSGIVTDLPQYRADPDYNSQERYQELLNLPLSFWFNPNGFALPALTAAEVTSILALSPVPTQRIWINSTLNKIQFLDTTGTLQTVTSV